MVLCCASPLHWVNAAQYQARLDQVHNKIEIQMDCCIWRSLAFENVLPELERTVIPALMFFRKASLAFPLECFCQFFEPKRTRSCKHVVLPNRRINTHHHFCIQSVEDIYTGKTLRKHCLPRREFCMTLIHAARSLCCRITWMTLGRAVAWL